MRRFLLMGAGLSLVIGLVLSSCSTDTMISEPAADASAIHQNRDVVPGRYIVLFAESAIATKGEDIQSFTIAEREMRVDEAVDKMTSTLKINSDKVDLVFAAALQGVVFDNLTAEEVRRLQNDRTVKHIQQDHWIVLPELEISRRGGGGKPGGGGTPPPTQTVPWGITQIGGHAMAPSGVTAWIIDSGIDTDHPDLNVNAGRGHNFVSKGKSTVNDGNGHGTHVAGTVGAIDNEIGVVGVAAGIELVPMRVLDNNGSGYFSWSVAAFNSVATNGAAGDVVNFSVGPSSRYNDPVIDAAVEGVGAKGIKVCLAAGNESDDAQYYSPAKVNAANVYTIGSMTSSLAISYFSNYGLPVDYYEPGSSVYSTYKDGGYATLSGTSMASPHACGILAFGGITDGGVITGVPSGTNVWGKR